MGHHRQCIACGNRFVAQRVTRRYCSDSCRLTFHRAVWNDVTGGKLSLLMRQVADSIDQGNAVRSQVTRLRVLLSRYDNHLMGLDFQRHYNPKVVRKRKTEA
jgi:hypothetical protein